MFSQKCDQKFQINEYSHRYSDWREDPNMDLINSSEDLDDFCKFYNGRISRSMVNEEIQRSKDDKCIKKLAFTHHTLQDEVDAKNGAPFPKPLRIPGTYGKSSRVEGCKCINACFNPEDCPMVRAAKKKPGIRKIKVKSTPPVTPVSVEPEEEEDKCTYSKDKSYRGYAITDFEMDVNFWEDQWNTDKYTYLLVCEETCPKTGELHWQTFVYYTNKSKYSACLKRFKPRHIGAIYATPSDNARYCKKGDQSKAEYREFGSKGPNYGLNCIIIFEQGECPQQGARTDLETIYEQIKKGEIRTKTGLANANISIACQYGKPLMELVEEAQESRSWKTEVWAIIGKGGTGKSRLARKLDPDVKAIKFTGDKKCPFILGYKGHPEVVMIEEFDPDCCTQEFWLEACDRYEMPVNIKGSETTWNPRKIYFTSNKDPSTWWGGWNRQTERRFTQILECDVDVEPEDLHPVRRKILMNKDGVILKDDVIPWKPEEEPKEVSLEESLAAGVQTKDGYTFTAKAVGEKVDANALTGHDRIAWEEAKRAEAEYKKSLVRLK